MSAAGDVATGPGWVAAKRGGPRKPAPTRADLALRAIPEPNTGCWLWAGAVDQHGYGQVRRKALGGTRRVVRLMAGARRGEVVRHRCDVPACINPDHLTLGTQADNIADAVARGRLCVGERRSPENIPRGERASWSKLTDSAVREIRASKESQRVLAARHGVSQSTISRVRAGKTWGHA